jgi:major type 1 subunit fimbrin (pilin)
MKKQTFATLSTLALTLTCSSAFAVDGTIRVNGVVTDGTCILQGEGSGVSGHKDLTVTLPTVPKSKFNTVSRKIEMVLKNATNTDFCDRVTNRAFRGIHLSVSSPSTDLDSEDKTLLVNKAIGAGGASTTNPIFIQIRANGIVDFSEPWGTQAKSQISYTDVYTAFAYYVSYYSKNWTVDAQNVHAVVNYTMHYN